MKPETRAVLFLATVVLVLSVLTIVTFFMSIGGDDGMPKGCPSENRTCPDGSVVWRMLPDCQFPSCENTSSKD